MSTSPVVIVMVLSFLKVAALAEKSPMLNSKVVSEAWLFSKSISPVVIEKAMFAKLLFSISASPEVMVTVPELRVVLVIVSSPARSSSVVVSSES